MLILPEANSCSAHWYEGGELVLRDTDRDGETRTASFDTPSLIAAGPNPSFFYVAFFSDVEHEVLPVTSGYRVTVTYNLYYAKGVPPASEVERAVALSTISEINQGHAKRICRSSPPP